MPAPGESKTISALSGCVREAIPRERRQTRYEVPPCLSPLSPALNRGEPRAEPRRGRQRGPGEGDSSAQHRGHLRSAPWTVPRQHRGQLPISTADSVLPRPPPARSSGAGTGWWLCRTRWVRSAGGSPPHTSPGRRRRSRPWDGRGLDCVWAGRKRCALPAAGASELVYSDLNAGKEKWMRKYSTPCDFIIGTERWICVRVSRGKGSAFTLLVYFFPVSPLRKWKLGKLEWELASVAIGSVARRMERGLAAVSWGLIGVWYQMKRKQPAPLRSPV